MNLFLSIVLLCSGVVTIVYGIGHQRPAVKACEDLEKTANVTDIDRFPFNVVLTYENSGGSDNLTYGCGGVLVDKKFVLTVAHCVFNFKPVAVLLKKSNNTDEKTHSVIYIRIKNTHLHPDYQFHSSNNDIAVLELDSEVTFAEDAYAICLATGVEDLDSSNTTFGTGYQRNVDRIFNRNVLVKGGAEIVPATKCNEILHSLNQAYNHISEKELCIMDSPEICETISGSPLISSVIAAQTGAQKQRLIGIKSKGFPCQHSRLTIYTKITAYLDFIENIIWPRK